MATLGTETHTRQDGTETTTYRVLFVDPAGRRQTIRLGSVSKKIAEAAKAKIEEILSAKIAVHSIQPETATWLAKIADVIHEKLSRVGLVEPRQTVEKVVVTLGQHLETLFAGLGPQKRMTRLNYDRARRLLEEHFGKDRRLDSIHEGDADDYKAWLLAPTEDRKAFALASASVDLRRARQFFKAAVRHRLIQANPFEEVKCGSQANPSRQAFVTHETIEAVIAACPNNDWRLIFALARYAGLRIPSELDDLRWSDIHWDRNRMTIRVPTKEHLAGHEERIVQIFAELRPHLEKAFDEAEDGAVYVVPRARGDRNLRRYAEQTIKKAGVKAWPKLFVNLRSSRETELMQAHPAHVVLAWIGHTAKVARSHYLQLTDSDFDQAASYPAHYPAQSTLPNALPEPSGLHQSREKRLHSPKNAKQKIPPAGIELSHDTRRKAILADPPGTLPGTPAAGELVELLRVLAALTPEERQGLLALARELGQSKEPPARRSRRSRS
jgi:hypothetical protein